MTDRLKYVAEILLEDELTDDKALTLAYIADELDKEDALNSQIRSYLDEEKYIPIYHEEEKSLRNSVGDKIASQRKVESSKIHGMDKTEKTGFSMKASNKFSDRYV